MIIEKTTEQTVSLYYDLYVPDGKAKPGRPLLIALHGYEGNKESMMAKALAINSEDFVIASVQGPNSFVMRDEKRPERPRVGFGWMMQYKAEETIRLHSSTVGSVIEELKREQDLDRAGIFLMAFSQSVSLNYRFAFSHPGLIRGVIAVCGGIPGDWDRAEYQTSRSTDILIIAGETDEFYPVERTRGFRDAMERRSGSVKYHSFPTGHVFPNQALPMINDWLRSRIPARSPGS